MNCRSCHTRLFDGEQKCPNCGAVSQQTSSGVAGSSGAHSSSSALSQPTMNLDEVELAPEQAVRETGPGSSQTRRREKPARRAAPAPAEAGPDSLGPVPPDELRTLLLVEPELLEPGLEVYTDETGRAAGAGFPTDVGAIDLLARDAGGRLVVVLIARAARSEQLVADVLQRVGWVRKHLGKGREDVRAIVLLDRPSQSLGYAAAAMADTVAFKTYKLSLRFDDLEF